ncbi:MAG TPA: NrpR regulatory domain-containing protein [Thermodesulfobacteriota bacterium]|nr:NrpR regulatory domain-containing protein [Thermodesulfobacteriota bacterium]HQO76909.1 NrpR regulatory domain-containing protein [Thermodesulfobacteriota bacterium]
MIDNVRMIEVTMTKLSQRKIHSILSVLHVAQRPLGGARLAQKLQEVSLELSQRTVRYYLQRMDQQGLTQNLGKRGRIITAKGEEELKSAFVIEKVGFIASKIDNLTCQMSFSFRKARGKIILNFSIFNKEYFSKAVFYIKSVFRAGLGMGRFVAVGYPGTNVGSFRISHGQVGIGTVCSVTINGIFLNEGIHLTSRFGGLLEMHNRMPVRFTQIINYDGTSIDPLEIFIKGGMTAAYQASLTGNGKIGASFREVPSVAIPKVMKIKKKLDALGMGGVLMVGKPGQALLDIPVSEGRAGMIVAGGLNPLAAVEECGIPTENVALGTLFDFDQLIPFWELDSSAAML